MNSCINGPEFFETFPTYVIEDKVKVINIVFSSDLNVNTTCLFFFLFF